MALSDGSRNDGSLGQQPDKDSDFGTFLLKEFDVISNAHHEAKTNAVTFFRYYLLVMAVPFGFLALLRDGRPLLDDVAHLSPGVSTLFMVLSLVGFLFAWHHYNLRIDSTLYARVCNGIRRYYYQSFPASTLDETEVRVLPTDNTVPSFNLLKAPLAWVFAFINCTYMAVGVSSLLSLSRGLLAALLLLLAHVSIVAYLCWSNERSWKRKSVAIGRTDAELGKA